MVGSVISAIANVAHNAIFIPRFSYYAVGHTTMTAYFLQSAIDY